MAEQTILQGQQAKIDSLQAANENMMRTRRDDQSRTDDLIANRSRINDIRREMNKQALLKNDFDTGIEKGKELISDGSLGRLDEKPLDRIDTKFDETSSADTQDILARRRENLKGLSSEDMLAQREQAVQGFGRDEETSRRRLSSIQSSLGVRGDTASNQQASVLFQGMQNRANFERDLILQNKQVKENALKVLKVRYVETRLLLIVPKPLMWEFNNLILDNNWLIKKLRSLTCLKQQKRDLVNYQ